MKKTRYSLMNKRRRLQRNISKYHQQYIFSLILLILIGIWTIPNTFSNFKIALEQKKEIEELALLIKETEKEYEENQNLLNNADSLEFVEKQAREKLGMVKAHELIVVFKDIDKDSKEDLGMVEKNEE